jgi:hypothetical protein
VEYIRGKGLREALEQAGVKPMDLEGITFSSL